MLTFKLLCPTCHGQGNIYIYKYKPATKRFLFWNYKDVDYRGEIHQCKTCKGTGWIRTVLPKTEVKCK